MNKEVKENKSKVLIALKKILKIPLILFCLIKD